MRAGDLDRAGAESRVGVFVGDDRDQAAVFLRPDRDFAEFPDDWRVTLIRWMNRDSAVAEHRLGPGRGDGDIVARLAEGDVSVLVLLDIFIGLAARERVLEVPHLALHLDLLDLEIGDRGLEMRVPVDEALAAIDQALLVHLHEDLDDGIVEVALVRGGGARRAGHGEGVAGPVAGRAEALELVDDGVAGLALPLPHLLEEGLAPHLAAGGVGFVLRQFAFDDHLGGDAGMVLTGLPERVEAAHPVPADEDVLQRVVEGVAHVERAGDVGRRDHDGERLRPRLRVRARLEGAGLFPGVVEARLRLGGVEGLFHHCRPVLCRVSLSEWAGRGEGAAIPPGCRRRR